MSRHIYSSQAYQGRYAWLQQKKHSEQLALSMASSLPRRGVGEQEEQSMRDVVKSGTSMPEHVDYKTLSVMNRLKNLKYA